MASPLPRRHEVEYPESDGKPMGETDFHVALMAYLIDALRRRFADDPAIYIAGNNFVYYEEGNPAAVVSPDVYVVRGVPSGLRRTYKLWLERQPPELVIELTSRSTHLEDLGNKRAIYEELGVKEYVIFDPEGDRFDPPFRAFRLEGGALRPVTPRIAPDGATVFHSEVVGLELHARGTELRLVDPETGLALPSSLELAREVDAQARRVEEERQRAADATVRADTERARAEAAEAEVARVREELERLRGRPR